MDYGFELKPESGLPEEEGSDRVQLGELRRRLTLAPHNNGLRLYLAQWLAKHGRRKEAIEELRTLVRLDPNHLVARKLREELTHSCSEKAEPAQI